MKCSVEHHKFSKHLENANSSWLMTILSINRIETPLMLHELLLSLLGHPSPLFSSSAVNNDGQQSIRRGLPLLSPSEQALTSTLAQVGNLHHQLLKHTQKISSSHNSTICRAVATSISTKQLASFQQTVCDAEKQILTRDAARVGAYDIVPLSSLVGEFNGWSRRLEWLWTLATFILPQHGTEGGKGKPCTGANVIDWLRQESQTGFPDIEEVALSLVQVAETAWLRQLSTWVLYGRLPTFGGEDFFIQELGESQDTMIRGMSNFGIEKNLLPKFVSSSTASSILFVGRSLNHIRLRSSSIFQIRGGCISPEHALLPGHLRHLATLKSPISPSSLNRVIGAIRLSLSQNALHRLLPIEKILEMLFLLREFFLLGRGEFAITLVREADQCIQSRWKHSRQANKSKDTLGGVVIKEGEVNAVLSRTWATLSTFQIEDAADDQLDLARELIYLSLSKSSLTASSAGDHTVAHPNSKSSKASFSTLLFSSPVTLSLHVPSPLDLFIVQADLRTYAEIHAYLLCIRRAHLHLTDLWKITQLRREQTTSSNQSGDVFARKRQRANERTKHMRNPWAIVRAAAFLLAELESYFQGDVVGGSWEDFRAWLEGSSDECTSPTQAGDIWLDPVIGTETSSQPTAKPQRSHDPQKLTLSHQTYLSSLSSRLFLTSISFTSALYRFLKSIDHFVALIQRLQVVQTSLDLETDEGVYDTFTDFRQEEREVLMNLAHVGEEVRSGLECVVRSLREVGINGESRELSQDARGGDDGVYAPKKIGGVDRLLMKLDFGGFSATEDITKKGRIIKPQNGTDKDDSEGDEVHEEEEDEEEKETDEDDG
jgi:hypothetical protein